MEKNSDLCRFRGHEDLTALSRSELDFVRHVRSLSLRCKKIFEDAKKLKSGSLVTPNTITYNGKLYVLFENLSNELQNSVVNYSDWLLGKYDCAVSRCRFFSPQAKVNVRALVGAGIISPCDIVAALLAEDGFSTHIIEQIDIF